MNTKDKILQASLELFNDEGEQDITAVDIANVLEMSPGNLYYHFKGKDPIIHRLFIDFENDFKSVLQAPIEAPLELADNWVYFYILFEAVANFRFFYRNQQSLTERYADLEPRFRALIQLKINTMASIIRELNKQNFIAISDIEAEQMAERFAQQLTYWPIFHRVMTPTTSLPIAIHHGVFNMIIQLSPHVSAGPKEFLQLITEFRDKMLSTFQQKNNQ